MLDHIKLIVAKRLKEDLLDEDLRNDLNKMPEQLGMIALQVHKLNLFIEEAITTLDDRIRRLENDKEQ